MKTFITRKRLRQAMLALPLLGALSAGAQDNIAPAATVLHHDLGQPGGGIGLHSAHNYNDGFIGDYPGTSYATGTVNSQGFIEFSWPNPQTFNRVVAYMGTSAFANATVEQWDGSAWQQVTNFRPSSVVADSVDFNAITTTKLRLSRISAAGKGQPSDFREIVIRQVMPGKPCSGTPTAAGTVLPLDQSRCLGDDVTLVAGNYQLGAAFQWQVNDGKGWQNIPGATGTWYHFRVTAATPVNGQYRLKSTCTNEVFSSVANVSVSGGNNAPFATLPYFEGFEKPWSDGCDLADIASASWTSSNADGLYRWASGDSRNSKFAWQGYVSGKNSARFYSIQKTTPVDPYESNLDLSVNCSAQPGMHQLQFYYVNQEGPKGSTPGNDFMVVYVSQDGGKTFEPVGGWEDEPNWNKKNILFYSAGANTIIRFRGFSNSSPTGVTEQTDIGLDSIFVKAVDPCSGTPSTPVVTPAGPLALCAGTATTLSASGIDQVPGISIQWEQSLTGGAPWTNAVGGSGSTTPVYSTPKLYDTLWYRLKVNCSNSGLSSQSATIALRTPSPIYASIPFTEDFERWTKRCDTLNDVPSLSWVSTPYQGGNSWRRDDEGNEPWGFNTVWTPGDIYVFDSWKSASGKYPDVAFHGDHSARFHTYGNQGKTGTMDLFIDCSTHPGDKELRFALNLTKDKPANVNNPNPAPNGYDYLEVFLSTDGGATFTLLDKIAGPAFSKWEIKSLPIASNSATTVIRFSATSVTGYKDMGLDYVRVLPGCTQMPAAGTIDSIAPCLDKDFFLKLSGSSQSTGLVYQWQRSTNGSSWINMPGTNSDAYLTQISAATWFRVIVTCSGSGMKDTTPVRLVNPAAFYYCYCESGFDAERTLNYNYDLTSCGKNIGNVTITTPSKDTLLSNGDYRSWFSYPKEGFYGYSNFTTTLPPTPLYRDSAYDFIIHSIHSSTVGSKPVKWTAYIDFDQDGIYDTLTERIWIDLYKNTDTRPAQGSGVPWDTYHFSVPSNAKPGITGMRVVMMGGSCTNIPDWNGGPVPCAKYGDGETEDYLVEIRYPECNGPANAGTAHISDTLYCPGYTVYLTDTTHEYNRHGISWDWQSSSNGTSWAAIAGSQGQDALSQVITGNSWYRLRMVCGNTGDTSYSNTVSVRMKEGYQCYCYSEATGKSLDSSDAGLVTINGRNFGAAGGHLNNAAAVNGRTDNTDQQIQVLVTDPLDLSLTHILRSARHADAKVTVFIDYNNNLQYDVPDERVWSTTTSSSSWNLTQTITIPGNVVKDKPTGMRVIINNNTDPNVPSDEACGPYVSGETEDYVVIFTENPIVGVANINGIRSVNIYPNPASGKVYVQYLGATQDKATLSVLSMAGQVLQTQDLSKVVNNSIIELDLSGMANGVYYIHFGSPSGQVNQKLTLLGQ